MFHVEETQAYKQKEKKVNEILQSNSKANQMSRNRSYEATPHK